MKRVLLVEDDHFIRDMVASKLQQHDFNIKTAGNGTDALAQMKEETPDVILLDLALPDMHGTDVLRRVVEDPELEKLPVIVFSNEDDDESRAKAAEYGVAGYFIKVDTDFSDLVTKINEVVSG